MVKLSPTLYAFSLLSITLAAKFNPRSYEKHRAKCSAVVRDDPANTAHTQLSIEYVDTNPNNSKESIIMVHGWPSLWSSWSNQITEFEKTHRIIALDQRGFGSSTHPGNVDTSATMGDLVSDLVCVLQDAGVDKAMCMGHDWGSQVCYEAARQRPDVFTSVVGLAIPYIPYHGPFVPNTHLLALSPKLAYQIFFDDHTARATEELNSDKGRTLRGTLRDVGSPPPEGFLKSRETFMGGWEGVGEIPPIPFFTPDEEAYFIEQYEIQGFGNTLYFYTHGPKHESWKHAQAQGNYTVECRALSILPLQDPVGDWVHAAKALQSAKYVPRLTTETVQAAHWPQLEQPEAVNRHIRKWMAAGEQEEKSGRDEL